MDFSQYLPDQGAIFGGGATALDDPLANAFPDSGDLGGALSRGANYLSMIQQNPEDVLNDQNAPPQFRLKAATSYLKQREQKLLAEEAKKPKPTRLPFTPTPETYIKAGDPLYLAKKVPFLGSQLDQVDQSFVNKAIEKIGKGTATRDDYERYADVMLKAEKAQNWGLVTKLTDGLLTTAKIGGELAVPLGEVGVAGKGILGLAKATATKAAIDVPGWSLGATQRQQGTLAPNAQGGFDLQEGSSPESAVAMAFLDSAVQKGVEIGGGKLLNQAVSKVIPTSLKSALGGMFQKASAAVPGLSAAQFSKSFGNAVKRVRNTTGGIIGGPFEEWTEERWQELAGGLMATPGQEDFGISGKVARAEYGDAAQEQLVEGLILGLLQAPSTISTTAEGLRRQGRMDEIPKLRQTNATDRDRVAKMYSDMDLAAQWSAHNPEAAQKMVSLDKPSRSAWREITGFMVDGNPEQRTAFADNVRKAVASRQPARREGAPLPDAGVRIDNDSGRRGPPTPTPQVDQGIPLQGATVPQFPSIQLTSEWQQVDPSVPLPQTGVEVQQDRFGQTFVRAAQPNKNGQERTNSTDKFGRLSVLEAMSIGQLNQEASKFGIKKGPKKAKMIEKIIAAEAGDRASQPQASTNVDMPVSPQNPVVDQPQTPAPVAVPNNEQSVGALPTAGVVPPSTPGINAEAPISPQIASVEPPPTPLPDQLAGASDDELHSFIQGMNGGTKVPAKPPKTFRARLEKEANKLLDAIPALRDALSGQPQQRPTARRTQQPDVPAAPQPSMENPSAVQQEEKGRQEGVLNPAVAQPAPASGEERTPARGVGEDEKARARQGLANRFPGSNIAELPPTKEHRGGYRVELPNGRFFDVLFLPKTSLMNRESVVKSLRGQLKREPTAEEISETVAKGGQGAFFVTTADGRRMPGLGAMALAVGNFDDTTINHEGLHLARRSGLFTETEWKALRDKYAPNAETDEDAEEQIAYSTAAWKEKSSLSEKIKAFFANLLSALGITPDARTVEVLMQSPEFWARTPTNETVAPPQAAPTSQSSSESKDDPRDKVFEQMTKLKGAQDKGGGIFYFPESVLTAERRKRLMTDRERERITGRIESTFNFEFKDWADVTGNPSDRGYAILDRRARNRERTKVQPESKTDSRENWQIPRDEYVERAAKRVSGQTAPKTKKLAKTVHAIAVREAVDAGKPVPPEVLRDYPNLTQPDVQFTSEVQTKAPTTAAPAFDPTPTNEVQTDKLVLRNEKPKKTAPKEVQPKETQQNLISGKDLLPGQQDLLPNMDKKGPIEGEDYPEGWNAKDYKVLLGQTRDRINQVNAEWNAALDDVLGSKDKHTTAMRLLKIRNHRDRGGDADSMRFFDETLQVARSQQPQLLSGPDIDEAANFIDNVSKGYRQPVTINSPQVNKEAWQEAERTSPPEPMGDAYEDRYGGGNIAPQGDVPFQVAYHGSPHKFDRFTTQKIGTGEGAQAYGWGMYFAGKKDVADWYKSALGGKVLVTVDGDTFDAMRHSHEPVRQAAIWLDESSGNLDKAIEAAKQRVSNETDHMLKAEKSRALAILEGWNRKGATVDVRKGHGYVVDLKPAEDEYLLWDKPLSEQSEKVKAALGTVLEGAAWEKESWPMSGYRLRNKDGQSILFNQKPVDVMELTGQRAYKTLFPSTTSDQEASQALRELGIRGIKYLDGSSRNRRGVPDAIVDNVDVNGESKWVVHDSDYDELYMADTQEEAERWAAEYRKGSYNYVIFDDADVEIQGNFQVRQRANIGEDAKTRRFVQEQDPTYNPEQKADIEVAQQASQRLKENGYDVERAKLLKVAAEGGQLNDVDTVVARRVFNAEAQEALRTGDAKAILEAQKVLEAYRRTGTEQGRAFRQRRDWQETPDQERRRILAEAVLTPPTKDKKAIDDAMKEGNTAEAERLRKKWADEYNALKKRLILLGVDLDNLSPYGYDPVKAARALGTVSAAKADMWDKAYEYWRNAILSGTGTQVTNLGGTAVHGGWKFLIERPIEALANTIVGRPEGAQLGEFKHVASGILPGLQRGARNALAAWQSELPELERQLKKEGQWRIEEPNIAIKGTKGRVIRWPQRLMLAADDFMKSLFATMDVGAQAYRQAKAQGLTGDKMRQYIEQEVNDLSSGSWSLAHDTALELAFQQKGTKAARAAKRALLDLRRDVEVLGMKPLAFIFPFVTTPVNILETGLRKAPVTGDLAAMKKMWDNWRAGRATLQDMTPRLAERIIAWGTVLALSTLTGGEDDEPFITGTVGSKERGRRDLSRRTFPAQSIRIGGRWYSYSRVEPFATALALTVDWVNAGKEAKKTGDYTGVATAPFTSLLDQMKDKTFLDGVGDVMRVIESPEPVEEMANWSANFAVSWVPNIVRSTARAASDTFPERGVWGDGNDKALRLGKRMLQRTELGLVKDQPAIDLWGREAKRGTSPVPHTDLLWRIMSPSETRIPELFDGDRAILNWNSKHPNDEYLPVMPQRSFLVDGKRVALTDEQLTDYLRLSGTIAKTMVERLRIDPENPTSETIAEIKNAVETAREKAREALKDEWKGGPRRTPQEIAKVEFERDINQQADVLSRVPPTKRADRAKWLVERTAALNWLKAKGVSKAEVTKSYTSELRKIKTPKTRFEKRARLLRSLSAL